MILTDAKIRAAKPGARLVKLSDGGGLQLWITPDGAKRWRLAYRLAGAQKSLAIGVYPATGLQMAREARKDAKRLLADGQDPAFVKKLAKATKATASANTFEAIAAELLDKKRREGKAGTIKSIAYRIGLAIMGSSGQRFGQHPRHFVVRPARIADLQSQGLAGARMTCRNSFGQ
jgi:hypothetical protein